MVEDGYHEDGRSIPKLNQIKEVAEGHKVLLTSHPVTSKILKFLDKTIYLTFLALVIITPLLFSTQNSELFEVPKMLFVYLGAVIILIISHLKFVLQKKHPYPINLIFISILMLLLTQIASTVTSIDKFTSIYGFPSRLNGGILSLIAYIIIFAGALINLDREKIRTILTASVTAALAVSLWGIPGHFGYDPNCFILTGHLTSSCWQKEFDPTLRIFSTMGQPNWLASYLVLIIPVSIGMLTLAKKTREKLFFIFSTIIILTALILTDSRAGFAGFIVSLVIFVIMFGWKNLRKFTKILIPLFVISLAIGVIFGTSLIARTKEALNGTSSALGTESGQIRLIVWRGALAVFKSHPILGTGPETFAYSYYQVRPKEHNQTTEWNFFYNKAHNEFLNYLANTGALGFTAYMAFLLITLFTLWQIAKVEDNQTATISKAALASIAGYLVTIFFGFSTVATQLLMFVQIACVLVLAKQQKLKFISLNFLNSKLAVIASLVVSAVGLVLIIYVVRLYVSDLFITRARSFDTGYENAIKFFPTKNPFYLADAAYSAINSNNLESAATKADEAAKIAPNNLLILRRVANSYFLLSNFDPKFIQKALEVCQRMANLAPTDPQTYLAIAKIQTGLGKVDDAKKTLEVTLQLKPDYLEAQQILDQIKNGTYNNGAHQ